MKPPKEVVADLKTKGFKLGRWERTAANDPDETKWLNYCSKEIDGKRVNCLLTVAHVTGSYVVEVLVSHMVFSVQEALQTTKKSGI